MTMALSPTAAGYPESQLEQDEIYPCKGCGEILEEGKAFELAGNRWHIDCFRCNTCHTLLDSDANLLLLGDGSLICNNCTYSCHACGNKIEDLAILTGDQAFCASCFRCRNCKEKIENLRYARTTQGIFCMSCHESVIQKRRKNRHKQKQTGANGLDKKLPELPRPYVPPTAFSSDGADTPLSEKLSDADKAIDGEPTRKGSRRDAAKNGLKDRSSTSKRESNDNLTLPASTYSGSQPPASKHPGLSAAVYDPANELNEFFVPLVLDPTPATTSSPHSNERDFLDPATKGQEPKATSRDFLKGSLHPRPSKEYLHDSLQQTSRSSSTERRAGTVPSPHIAYQEKGRQPSDHISDQARKRAHATSPQVTESNVPSPYSATATDFKLQEAPKSKKTGSRRSSKDNARSPAVVSPTDSFSKKATPQIDMPLTSSPTDGEPKRSLFSQDSYSDRSPANRSMSRDRPAQPVERPRRGDSLAAGRTRKEVPPSSPPVQHISELTHHRKASSSSQQMNGGMTISSPIDNSSISKSIYDQKSRQTSSQSNNSDTTIGAFTAPRHAPAPPVTNKSSDSNSTGQSETSDSPRHMPNHFSLDSFGDDARRDENNEPGVLRKMSNAVRGHARSVSDRVISSPRSQKWTKSPINGSVDLGSPTASLSPESREENIMGRSQLRRAQQRIAELEAEKNNLQTIVNGSPEMNQMNSAIREKRSTMAVLDTQREMVVRELEVMTDHLKRVKDSSQPLEMTTFKSEVLTDFSGSLKRLKDSLTSEVEGLIQRRNDLTEEITSLIQMKDKGFQEYENLSNRNTSLIQQNNELVQSIQDMMKTHKSPNGLGLYLPGSGAKDKSEASSNDLRHLMLDSSSTFAQDLEQEPAVITTPHVVKMKQTKPNMLRKGGFGKTLRGIRGALVPERERERTPVQTEGVAYNSVQDANTGAGRSATERNFRGFFGTSDKGSARHLKSMQNSSNPSLTSETVSASQLFGSDLPARCEFEKRDIPCIVSRCVEEVELRGMDAEGVYRKSGGSGQVNQVKAGFEQSNEYDISDAELEIHAVTSCLKQYFRRLPVPLITFNVYDHLLDATRVEDQDKRAVRMREAIDKLPKAHRDCLEFLIFHLARVTGREKDNLMTPLNLAVVFAPTIMRPATIEREMMDMQIQRQAVQSLIELNKAIFDGAE